ncbi:AER161Cp [Eremothecium gossypii ATCC 10895]|uniref:AER161Cp n=1 Tax=Eremothecium gossypii (strain ATCC 10895 / CBS 109.51 / FGSC 9923 / NRRL Y-1056) TaxID=284811 RepID=Q756U1_EREGS|nr:AER161Cp [Eremothecium gossypii ATCC 10895]AAS52843.1 AER161Cp [Eremothecium gossypii ATCC 10895]AEY97150.1 FAER161Cp [Eremothecium gossypii FDAG1]
MEEEQLYARLHQRYPIARLPALLAALSNPVLHVALLIKNFELICERNAHYAKRLLKWMVDEPIEKHVRLEAGSEDEDFSEWSYARYATLLSLGARDPSAADVVRYTFAAGVAIDVRETPGVIAAAGTTGHRTWEAALYLADYLCRVPLRQSVALELGAGTGLVSLAWLRSRPESSAYITDGDSALLEGHLAENLALNGLRSSPRASLRRLWWNVDEVPQNDIVLAADVTYDSTVLPDLCACIHHSLADCGSQLALVAATVRNELTVANFERELERLGIAHTIVSSTETSEAEADRFSTNYIFQASVAPIRIYKLTL